MFFQERSRCIMITMWQKIIQGWRRGFGLETNFFRLWLANVVIFIFIGLFANNHQAELATFWFATVLIVVNSLILFLLIKEFPKIKLAMSVFLIVFNAVLFGYYYFSSVTIIF